MITVKLLLFILAFLLLVLQALGVSTQRVSLGWLGLALWLLGIIIT